MIRLEPGLEFLPGLVLVRPLGRGGMGEAWVARDERRGGEVVAKILPEGAPEERVALLRREARLVRKLDHPSIVPVYGFDRGAWGSAVLLRYMAGGDAGRLRGASPLEIVRLGREVAEALSYLHGLGVVHRDVKASNVLLDAEGRGHLGDFGIAAVAVPEDDEGLVLRGGGSRASMSPQQRTGEPAAPADDVYALGALLYELLSGRPPFPSDATDEELCQSPRPLQPRHPIPAELRDLVLSMLAIEPGDRPRDANAVVAALAAMEKALPPRRGEEPLRSSVPVAPAWTGSTGTAGQSFDDPPTDPPPSTNRRPAVRLQPPPRVPEFAVLPSLAAEAGTSAAPGGRRASRGLPLTQAVILGSLALAALFVALVLPRWVRKPVASSTSSERADASPAPTPTTTPGSPGLAAEATPGLPEASPAPARAPTRTAPSPVTTPSPADDRRRAGSEAPVRRDAAPASADNARAGAAADRARQDELASAMSAAYAALDRADFAAARQAFERAGAAQPGSPAVADGLRRLEESERLAALAGHREAARGFEGGEDWPRALAEYEAALRIDPTLAFALEGRRRASRRALLSEKLDFHARNPGRLGTDAVAREAEILLQEAQEVSAPGPRLVGQIETLERALARARTEVTVVLSSDGRTDVVVHKVGPLGAFTRKSLELRPGTYTVVGTRRGFRDVRRTLVVEPEAEPAPLDVRCEEAI